MIGAEIQHAHVQGGITYAFVINFIERFRQFDGGGGHRNYQIPTAKNEKFL